MADLKADSLADDNPQSLHLRQLATLPASDPRRRELHAHIAGLPPAERRPWDRLLQETDLLYSALANTQPAADLTDKLLAIPDTIVLESRWKRLTAQPVSWRGYAAGLLILLTIAAYVLWPTRNPLTIPPPAGPAQTVAALAVGIHANPPPLEITSADSQAVGRKLQQDAPWPFTVQILEPRDKNFHLLGGGRCNFGPTPAVFTRWQAGATTYTLYQFDGKELHLPAQFATTQTSPHDLASYRVVLWPGGNYGACTWALVLENNQATDAFSSVY